MEWIGRYRSSYNDVPLISRMIHESDILHSNIYRDCERDYERDAEVYIKQECEDW